MVAAWNTDLKYAGSNSLRILHFFFILNLKDSNQIQIQGTLYELGINNKFPAQKRTVNKNHHLVKIVFF